MRRRAWMGCWGRYSWLLRRKSQKAEVDRGAAYANLTCPCYAAYRDDLYPPTKNLVTVWTGCCTQGPNNAPPGHSLWDCRCLRQCVGINRLFDPGDRRHVPPHSCHACLRSGHVSVVHRESELEFRIQRLGPAQHGRLCIHLLLRLGPQSGRAMDRHRPPWHPPHSSTGTGDHRYCMLAVHCPAILGL
jgi:hypothetical protein